MMFIFSTKSFIGNRKHFFSKDIVLNQFLFKLFYVNDKFAECIHVERQKIIFFSVTKKRNTIGFGGCLE